MESDAMNPTDGLCKICSELVNFKSAIHSLLVEDFDIGSLHYVKLRAKDGCKLCTAFECKIRSFDGSSTIKVRRQLQSYGYLSSEIQRGLYFEIILKPTSLSPSEEAFIISRVSVIAKRGACRLWSFYNENIDRRYMTSKSWQSDNPRRVKYKTFQDWMYQCVSNHRDCGSVIGNRFKEQIDLLVIDVHQYKLIRASSSCRYVAVSYVRGNIPMPDTSKLNLEERLSKNSLLGLTGIQTVLDAIEVTRQLGERYLWCDALCIISDDPIHKHSQINSMDIIYSQALVTLTAISGVDANTGLAGVSRDFASERTIGRTEDMWFVPESPNVLDILSSTPYESRGWTLQERLLSQRCIFFTEENAYALCTESVLFVDDVGKVKVDDPKDSRFYGTSSFPKVDLNPVLSYKNLVEIYSSRKFSYPADILSALSGIAHSWAQIYSTSLHTCHFASGLPESVFYVALLWEPMGDVRRRTDPNEVTYFPSWSWAGWIGPVKPLSPVKWARFSQYKNFDAGDINEYDSCNSPPWLESEGGQLRPSKQHARR